MSFSTLDSGNSSPSIESLNNAVDRLLRDTVGVFQGADSVRQILTDLDLFDETIFGEVFSDIHALDTTSFDSVVVYFRAFMIYICRLFRCRHVDSNLYFQLQRCVKRLLPDVFSDDPETRSRVDCEIDAIILGQIDLSISSENMERYGDLSSSAMLFEHDDIPKQSLFTAAAALQGKWSSRGSLPVDWHVTRLGVANFGDRDPDMQSRSMECTSKADGIRADVVRDSRALAEERDVLFKIAQDVEKKPLVDIDARKADLRRRVAGSRQIWLDRYGVLVTKYGLTVPPSVFYIPIVIGTGDISGSVNAKEVTYGIYFGLYNSRDWIGDSVIGIEDQYRHNDQFRKICLKSLGERRGFFKTVMYAVTHSANSVEVAFGLQMLADYCNCEKDITFLGAVLCEFAPILNRSGQQILFIFLYLIRDRDEEYGDVISRCVGILFMQLPRAVKISHTGVDFDENSLPWLKFFDPEELDKIKQRCFRAENSQRKVSESLRGVNPPSGFDKSALLGAIDEHKSVPLCETVEVDCSSVVPTNIHVFLHPVASVPEAESGRSTWRATIVIFQQNGSRSTYSIVNGSLRGGSFRGSVDDPTVNAACEWIAVYAANKYYVRRAEEIAREAVTRTVDRVDGGGDSVVCHSAVQKVAGRVMGSTLEVDIREKPLDQAAVEREGRNRARIDGNLADIASLLEGKEVDLNRILLFRRVDGFKKGRDFYERVPVDEIVGIVDSGSLRGRDLYVMTRLPYPTPAGFYEKRVGDTFWPIGADEVIGLTKSDEVPDEAIDPTQSNEVPDEAIGLTGSDDESTKEAMASVEGGKVVTEVIYERCGKRKFVPIDRRQLKKDPRFKEIVLYRKCPDGKRLRALAPRQPTDHSAYAYEFVYLANGFEPLGEQELKPYDANLGVRTDAVYDPERVVSVSTEGDSSSKIVSRSVRLDTNAQILMALRSGWFEAWLDKQEQDIRQDMEDVRNSGLSVEEESRLLGEMEEKIRKLRQEQTESANSSCIMLGSDGASGRFALPGHVQSNRLFNQGTFKPLEEVFPE
ncbi:MAG: hypothetical protein WCT46_04605 [Candidatus Gracilibacteria bacterium]